jgi:hypothetical protein
MYFDQYVCLVNASIHFTLCQKATIVSNIGRYIIIKIKILDYCKREFITEASAFM